MHPPVSDYAGRSVLVTGGRGYLGSALASALAGAECSLVLADRSPAHAWSPAPARARVRIVTADLSRRDSWEALLPGVDIVFHLAGTDYVRDASATALADWRCNALPVIHMLSVCRERGHRPRIVFASSANLFGRGSTTPLAEGAPDEPLIAWSAHKLIAEQELRLHAAEHAVASVALRLANVYGPSARSEADERVATNRMIRDAAQGRPLVLFRNSGCIRDLVFIGDAVDAFLLAGAQAVADGTYRVIGSGVPTSFEALCRLTAAKVRARTGRAVAIAYDFTVPCDTFDSRNFVADASRFRRETGWNPRVGLEEGIERTLESLAHGSEVARAPAGP